MSISRRNLGFLLSALTSAAAAEPKTRLPSKAYRFEDLTVSGGGPMRSRAILTGESHSGVLLDLHETELAAGQAPHAPHHHVHEEILLVREGHVEISMSGGKTVLGPGSVAYIASNEEHGWRNAGSTPAQYFVLAVGRDDT